MLSMNDVQLLWEVMSRCDDVNSAKIARIIRDDLNGHYINKGKVAKPAKHADEINSAAHEWLKHQEWAIRQTVEDMGEWLAENETNNRFLDEFRDGNKIALIKRFRMLSQAYYPTTYDDKPQYCGLKQTKDAIEIVFGRYLKVHASF